MKLRNFLIFIGLWIAFLPHIGFGINLENVLFSITSFILIIASFYVAAIEDKHKHKRVIKNQTLETISDNISTKIAQPMNAIKNTVGGLRRVSKNTGKIEQGNRTHSLKKVERTETVVQENPEEDVFVIEEEGGAPRIKKAVSDVKLKTDQLDDLIS